MSVFCANNRINAISEQKKNKKKIKNRMCRSNSVQILRNQSEGKLILFLFQFIFFFHFFIFFGLFSQSQRTRIYIHAHRMC